MKRKTREEKGITLIALIITIVVLLILAVVAINSVTGDGIIQHATNAKTTYENAQAKEESMLLEYVDYLKGLESVESLQKKYDFYYYTSISKAVEDVNSEEIGVNEDAEKSNAVAGVYINDNKINVVLLQDTTESTRITAAKNMTINLGGHILTQNGDKVAIDGLIDNNVFVTIDARLNGSGVSITNKTGNATAIQPRGSNFKVLGGTYTAVSYGNDAKGIAVIEPGGVANIIDATINVCAYDESGTARGIIANPGTTINIKNSSVYADAEEIALSNSLGVWSKGTVTMESCNIYGSSCGAYLYHDSNTYVVGGEYSGAQQGGFYFQASSKTYIEGTKISCVNYRGDFNKTYEKVAAFIVGGESNVEVYLNNCNINDNNARHVFLLRNSEGEKDNSVYLSNSNINLNSTSKISINDNHRLYIGVGCNFTADNTDNPSAVENTETIYKK